MSHKSFPASLKYLKSLSGPVHITVLYTVKLSWFCFFLGFWMVPSLINALTSRRAKYPTSKVPHTKGMFYKQKGCEWHMLHSDARKVIRFQRSSTGAGESMRPGIELTENTAFASRRRIAETANLVINWPQLYEITARGINNCTGSVHCAENLCMLWDMGLLPITPLTKLLPPIW